MVSTYGEPTTLDELFEAVRLTLVDKLKRARVIGFAWNIAYMENVRCSHCSPAGELNNWSGNDEGRPKSFPGWQGRVWIRTANDPKGWLSENFSQTLTYPGTGGGGSYEGPWRGVSEARYRAYGYSKAAAGEKRYPEVRSWSWDYKIFSKDFPLIVEEYTKSMLLDAIKTGKHQIVMNSNLSWTDDKTAHADEMFLAEVQREDLKDLELFA